MKNINILILGFWICSCGSSNSPAPISFSETKGDAGYVQLNITSSQNSDVIKIAKIAKYKIIIEGDDFESMEQVVSSEASGLIIESLPVGSNRTIRVLALNAHDQILRDGKIENINIEKGRTTEINLPLNAVPIVINMTSGQSLNNQHFYFSILTDPKHRLIVEEGSALIDIVRSSSQVEAGPTGRIQFYPGVLPVGEHHFIIRDLDNGQSSSLTLHLWDGKGMQSAPLFAASNIAQQRFGQVFARTGRVDLNAGELFSNIVEALWRTE